MTSPSDFTVLALSISIKHALNHISEGKPEFAAAILKDAQETIRRAKQECAA